MFSLLAYGVGGLLTAASVYSIANSFFGNSKHGRSKGDNFTISTAGIERSTQTATVAQEVIKGLEKMHELLTTKEVLTSTTEQNVDVMKLKEETNVAQPVTSPSAGTIKTTSTATIIEKVVTMKRFMVPLYHKGIETTPNTVSDKKAANSKEYKFSQFDSVARRSIMDTEQLQKINTVATDDEKPSSKLNSEDAIAKVSLVEKRLLPENELGYIIHKKENGTNSKQTAQSEQISKSNTVVKELVRATEVPNVKTEISKSFETPSNAVGDKKAANSKEYKFSQFEKRILPENELSQFEKRILPENELGYIIHKKENGTNFKQTAQSEQITKSNTVVKELMRATEVPNVKTAISKALETPSNAVGDKKAANGKEYKFSQFEKRILPENELGYIIHKKENGANSKQTAQSEQTTKSNTVVKELVRTTEVPNVKTAISKAFETPSNAVGDKKAANSKEYKFGQFDSVARRSIMDTEQLQKINTAPTDDEEPTSKLNSEDAIAKASLVEKRLLPENEQGHMIHNNRNRTKVYKFADFN